MSEFDPSRPFTRGASPTKGAAPDKFDPARPFKASRAAPQQAAAQPAPQETVEPSFLDALAARARQIGENPGQEIGAAANRALANLLQGPSLNTAHIWAPHINALADEAREMVNATPAADYSDRVRRHREQWLADIDPALAAAAAGPIMGAAGAISPALNTLPGLLAANATYSTAEVDRRGGDIFSPGGAADAAMSTAVSTAIPYGLKAVGWVGGKAAETLRPAWQTLRDLARGGYVRPTEPAKRLMGEGVELTLGRMDPASPLGRFEEIAANSAVGSDLAGKRAAMAPQTRDLLIRKAAAPGAQPPTAGAPVATQIEELKAGYTDLYEDALGGVRIQPDQYRGAGKWVGFFTDPTLKGAAKTKGAFERAIEVPDANPSVKRRALAWLKDAAGRNNLVPRKSGADVGTVEARAVQQLRSDIRTKARSYQGKEGDEAPQFEEIFKRAEEFTTELLEGQLPPANVEKLRTADTHWRNFLAVEDAATGKIAHRNEGDFTADQLLDAIWRAKGVTPGLSQAAHDVRAVMNPTYPKTGALPGAANTLLEGKYFGPLFARLANSDPALRSHALGASTAPWFLRAPVAAGDAVERFGPSLYAASQSPATISPTMREFYELLSGHRDDGPPFQSLTVPR